MTTYQFWLKGHLDRRWEAQFDGFTITHQLDVQQQPVTILVGPVADQAALYGLLARFRNLGVWLLSLQTLETNGRDSLPGEIQTSSPTKST